MSSFKNKLDIKQAPVNITACGDMLKLSFQDSNTYAGLINSPALSKLLTESCIQLSAVLVKPLAMRDQNMKRTKMYKQSLTQECPVRIVVYGRKCERLAIGNILSDAEFCLQHPLSGEYDQQVEYINPHYLLRPGAEMPQSEGLSICSDSGNSKSSETLDDADKGRFLRIFDLANGAENSLRAEPSPRIRSTLEEYGLSFLTLL